jgi:hypothetical protein
MAPENIISGTSSFFVSGARISSLRFACLAAR